MPRKYEPPSVTSIMRGTIRRPDYTLSAAGGAMGAPALYLNAAMYEDIIDALSCAYDQGHISAKGEWLLQDLRTLLHEVNTSAEAETLRAAYSDSFLALPKIRSPK